MNYRFISKLIGHTNKVNLIQRQ